MRAEAWRKKKEVRKRTGKRETKTIGKIKISRSSSLRMRFIKLRFRFTDNDEVTGLAPQDDLRDDQG